MTNSIQYSHSEDPFILEIRSNIRVAMQQVEREEGAIFLVKILEVFRKRVQLDITELEEGLVALDYDLIRRKSHLMVGSFRALGFNDGAQYARKSEYSAREQLEEQVRQSTQKLITYMQETLRIVNQTLPKEQ